MTQLEHIFFRFGSSWHVLILRSRTKYVENDVVGGIAGLSEGGWLCTLEGILVKSVGFWLECLDGKLDRNLDGPGDGKSTGETDG